MFGWLLRVIGRGVGLPVTGGGGAIAGASPEGPKVPAAAAAFVVPAAGVEAALNPFWTKSGLAGYLAAPRTLETILAAESQGRPLEAQQPLAGQLADLTDIDAEPADRKALDDRGDYAQAAAPQAQVDMLQALAAAQAETIAQLLHVAAALRAIGQDQSAMEPNAAGGRCERRTNFAQALRRVQMVNRPAARATPAKRQSQPVPVSMTAPAAPSQLFGTPAPSPLLQGATNVSALVIGGQTNTDGMPALARQNWPNRAA